MRKFSVKSVSFTCLIYLLKFRIFFNICLFLSVVLSIVSNKASIELEANPIPDAAATAANPPLAISAFPTGPAPATP